MPPLCRGGLSLGLVLAALTLPLVAQNPPRDLVRQPPARPPSQRDLDRLEAIKLYARGVRSEKNHQLLEAVRAFEKARRLDPESTTVARALIPLYLALERPDDALALCKTTLELDPADFD